MSATNPETADAAAPVTGPARATLSPVRPFYWSLRRELWEHPSLYLAPLAVVGLALVGFLISTYGLPAALRDLAAGERSPRLLLPYVFVALGTMLTGQIVAMLYSLSALYGERRDRSILFWKSLPVSDLTTVLSKAAMPIVVTPLVLLVLIIAAQVLMLAIDAGVALANGVDVSLIWSKLTLGLMWLVMAYGLPYLALWAAPIFAWFILVSVWAKRTPVLWAVAPPLALGLVERLATGTHYIWSWIGDRLAGGFVQAFSVGGEGRAPIHAVADIDPVRMLTAPELWIGLVLTVVFLGAAVYLRRSRDPI